MKRKRNTKKEGSLEVENIEDVSGVNDVSLEPLTNVPKRGKIEFDPDPGEGAELDAPSRLTNAEAAAFWSSWTEENVHVLKLVDNDVVIRNRAVKKLKQFLKNRSADEKRPFDETDMLKIWKGLHYCMWHSDKLLIQQELAGVLADLMVCFQTTSSALLFFKCFLLTIVREWDGIDAHRLNKFMTLIRRVFRSTILFIKRHHWDAELIRSALDTMRQTVLRPNSSSPNGLTFHMIDIYVDELTKVGGSVGKDAANSSMTQDALIDFMRPFVVFCLKEKNSTLLKAVERDIFEALISQVEEDFVDDLVEEGFEKRGKIDKVPLGGPRDRGAGLDQPGNRLPVDFGRLGEFLHKLGGGKRVPAANRKTLYRLAAKFVNLSQGVYPWEEIPVEGEEGRRQDGGMSRKEIEAAVGRIRKERERTVNVKEERKKKKKRKEDEEEEDEEEEEEQEEGLEDMEIEKDSVNTTSSKPKKSRKMRKRGKPSSGKERKQKKTPARNSIMSRSGEWTVKE